LSVELLESGTLQKSKGTNPSNKHGRGPATKIALKQK
jgi:hypothetical protein